MFLLYLLVRAFRVVSLNTFLSTITDFYFLPCFKMEVLFFVVKSSRLRVKKKHSKLQFCSLDKVVRYDNN